MSEFDGHIFDMNTRDYEKHQKIWKSVVEKYSEGNRITEKELVECMQYGLDMLDKTKMVAIEWAESILSQFSEEDALNIFLLRVV